MIPHTHTTPRSLRSLPTLLLLRRRTPTHPTPTTILILPSLHNGHCAPQCRTSTPHPRRSLLLHIHIPRHRSRILRRALTSPSHIPRSIAVTMIAARRSNERAHPIRYVGVLHRG